MERIHRDNVMSETQRGRLGKLLTFVGRRVASGLDKGDRRIREQYELHKAHVPRMYHIIESIPISAKLDDVRPSNMQLSKLSDITLVKYVEIGEQLINGYAIQEYACVIALRLKTYDENRAIQIYNSLTYANLSIQDVQAFREDTLHLAQLMILTADLDRADRLCSAIIAHDVYKYKTEHYAGKKLRNALWHYHLQDRNYIAFGAVALAVFGIFIASLFPCLYRLFRKCRNIHHLQTDDIHSTRLYPTVDLDGSLSMVEVPKVTFSTQSYDLPYLEDGVYGENGVISKPQYKNTSVTYVEGMTSAPTRHYLLGAPGAAFYYYDRHNPINYAAAAHGRLFVDNGPGLLTHPELIPIMEECANSLADKLTPMDDSIDYLSEEYRLRWIASRPYCALRKWQMSSAVLDGRTSSRVEPFLKDEGYPAGNKPPRMICARDDVGKTIYGPLFQSMNDEVFHLPFATKHIPNADRPTYIMNHLYMEGDFVYVVTDMSAFECAMRPHLQTHCEMIVYKRIIPTRYHYLLDKLLNDVTMRTRNGVVIKTPALRLSGEMNTSLGNTITNVISIETCAHVLHLNPGSYSYVCEGDDALLRLPRSVFYDDQGNLNDKWSPIMRNLGFNIKIENLGMPLGLAGYCSTYWDPAGNIVINPTKAFMTFYIGNNYMQPEEQLRMKALNYAISAPGEPLLWALCSHYLSGDGVARMKWSAYYYEELSSSLKLIVDDNGDLISTLHPRVTQPSAEQRAFFEDMFHISCPTQEYLEQELLIDPERGIRLVFEALGISEDYFVNWDNRVRYPAGVCWMDSPVE